MAHFTREDIYKLASLSKLQLTEEQVDKFRKELDEIVGYVEQLQSVDVSGLDPTNQVSGLVNSTRPDEVREYESVDALLKNLPDQQDGLIKVNRTVA